MKEVNYLTPAGAGNLRDKLKRYWENLSSAASVNFWIEPQGAGDKSVWVVRSSLVRGRPGPLLTPASTSNTEAPL